MPTFMGPMIASSGYGYAAVKVAEYLPSSWEIIDMRLPAELPPEIEYEEEDRRSWWLDGDVVVLCTPDNLRRIDASGRLFSFAMWETTRLPDGWAALLNERAAMVMVPSTWVQEVFVDNGVRTPIYVVKLGVDPEEYPLCYRRPGREPYTFLWHGTPDRRKGYDVAYRAFYKAFGHRSDVQLVMHFRQRPPGLNGARDPNVRVVEGIFCRTTIRSMYRRADCFVFPSRGEGWGLPPREAAATGLPVIATEWGGLAEDIAHWALPLRVRLMSRADYGYEGGEPGEWAEPDEEHLIELMRWCYEHQEQALRMGQRAAMWLRKHATWQDTARTICNLI